MKNPELTVKRPTRAISAILKEWSERERENEEEKEEEEESEKCSSWRNWSGKVITSPASWTNASKQLSVERVKEEGENCANLTFVCGFPKNTRVRKYAEGKRVLQIEGGLYQRSLKFKPLVIRSVTGAVLTFYFCSRERRWVNSLLLLLSREGSSSQQKQQFFSCQVAPRNATDGDYEQRERRYEKIGNGKCTSSHSNW